MICVRWGILAINPNEDLFCGACLKWMHIHATCVIPRERIGVYADTDTIPLALRSIVSMQYNEDEMQDLEVADQFYNMIDHNVEQISDTIAEVEPETAEASTTHMNATNLPALPSPVPPATPITPAARPLNVRRIDLHGL